MTRPDFKSVFPDGVDAEICEGYYDGRRPDSVEPGPNQHPAYIHGFKNGRDDLRGEPRKTAAEIRADLAYIEAALMEEAGS